jgi:hypothetical protein
MEQDEPLSPLEHVRQKVEERRADPRPTVYGSSMAEPFVGPPEPWQVRARQVGNSKRKPRRKVSE